MAISFDKVLKTDFDELEHLEEIVNTLAEEAGLDEEQSAGLMLCVSEAVTNGMLHGNKMDESKTVHLTAQASDGTVCVTVQDQGTGFDPDAVPDPLAEANLLKPSGRGVFLMKTYCDEVSYDHNGTRVTLIMRASHNS
jgi:serine/threonine-protein kinase RsbW